MLGAHRGVRLGVVLSVLLNGLLLARHHGDVDRRGAAWLLVPAVVGTPAAAALVAQLPERPAQAAAGAVVLLGALLLAVGARWAALTGNAGAVAAGAAAALTNAAAGVGGPPLALWAANAGWSPGRSRATLQVVFLGLNVVTLAVLGPPRVDGTVAGAAVLALLLGLSLAGPVGRRVTTAAARRTTLGLAALGGLAVVVRALA